jgi:glutathione S-transferase
MKLYIANKNYSSWSLRPWVLMREKGIQFEEIIHSFSATDNFEKFRNFSPTGKVPCLEHDGDVVWDSLAICEYLAEQYSGLWPENIAARAWARSASAEMHSGFNHLRNQCSMNCGLRVALNGIDDGLTTELDRLNELWSEGLTRFGGPYLAGQKFGIVDAFYAPVVFRMQTYSLKLGDQAQAYADRLLGLPAMQQWYEDALKETTREENHDKDSLAYGQLVSDLRAS